MLFSSCTDPTEEKAEVLSAFITEQGVSGSFILLKGEEVLVASSQGWADREAGLSFSSETPSNLGPLSEGITGAVIALLAEEGKLTLSDPLQQHIPSFPYSAITITHLLEHRSGIPDFKPYAMQYWDTTKTYSPAMLLDLFETMQPPLDFAPGSQQVINPVNYIMLAGLLDIYSSTFINEYLPYKLFQPLHMGDSHVYHQLIWDRPPKAARGYGDRQQTRIWEASWTDGLYGHANFYSSTRDLQRFILAIEANRGLLEGHLERLQASVEGEDMRYGFWANGKSYWRFGKHHGYAAGIYRNPDQDLTCIWLCNNNGIEPNELGGQVLQIMGESL